MNALHQFPELTAGKRIDAGRRFVQNEQIRIVDQRAAQPQLLLHAAGQFSRRAIGKGRKPGGLQKLRNAPFTLRAVVPEQPSEKIDIFALGFTIWEYLFGATCTGAHQIPFVSPDGEPFNGSVEEYAPAIDAGYTLKLPEKEGTSGVDDLLYGILNWMLQSDPAKRPDAATVAKVFLTRDESLIPAEYMRLDLDVLPPEADIELVSKEGVRVEWIPDPKTGTYTGKGKCFRVTRGTQYPILYSKADLIGAKLAKPKDGATVDLPASMHDPEGDKPWPSDNMPGVTLPACITRKPGVEGSYRFMDSAKFLYTKTMDELKAMGFFCAAEEERTFWPDDVRRNPGVVMKPDQVAFRLMSVGPGHYLVQPKRFVDQGKSRTFGSKRVTFDQLVPGNYATIGYDNGDPNISSEGDSAEISLLGDIPVDAGGGFKRGGNTFTPLRPDDHIAYQPNKIPSNVCAITRHSMGVHQYAITYDTGVRDIVSADELMAKGYVTGI